MRSFVPSTTITCERLRGLARLAFTCMSMIMRQVLSGRNSPPAQGQA